MRHTFGTLIAAVILGSLAIGVAYGVTAGEKIKVNGLITGRNGETLTMRTATLGDLTVVLTEQTKVQIPKGLLKVRKENMAVTALIPGLSIRMEGLGGENNRVVATKITFSRDDLETAEQIQAGLVPTQQQVQENQQNIAENRQNIQTNKENIAANQNDIQDINHRFSELSDYDIKFSSSVYFDVGNSSISEKGKSELTQLSINARNLKGYLIQVEGYADSSGNAARNQELSMQRAAAVVAYLAQNGNIPLLRILAPGAMGTSNPVSSNETAQGRAENRRVQVKVLVNRGVAASAAIQ
jgi:OOP family OmpA-OmpF porin